MRWTRKYQLLIVFTLSFMATAAVVAQNITKQDPDHQLKEAAREAVRYWEKELSLSSKQTNLMEKKILEYAIKKNQLLQSKMREEAKTKRLRLLQEQEYKDMRDILTEPQYEEYIALSKERIRKQNRKH